GYGRLSKGEDDGKGMLDQRARILDAYPEAEIREEVKSGGKARNRPVLTQARKELRRGDTLVVTKLDRLTRSLLDFADITAEAKRRDWNLVVLDQGFDMATPHGKAM